MSQASISFLLLASLALSVYAERFSTQGTTCSLTEKEGDTPYGVSLAYEVSECTTANCNVFNLNTAVKKVISASSPAKNRCVCGGPGGKRLFSMMTPKGKVCDLNVCWDHYATVMTLILNPKSSPSTWITSQNHWDASCVPGETNLPSIEEAVADAKKRGALTPQVEQKVDDMINIKDDDGPLEDEFDEEEYDEEDDSGCQDLKAAVVDAEARVEMEEEAGASSEQSIRELEESIEGEEKELEAYKKQKENFHGKYKRIVETEGGRTCSIYEVPEDHQYDVSFAYSMDSKCSTVSCNVIKFTSTIRKTIVEGTPQGTSCKCTMKGQDLITFTPSSMYSCDSEGCWSFYASIRRTAVYKEKGTYPSSGSWLDSANHFKAKCDEGATNAAISAVDLAKDLKARGATKAVDALMKVVVFDEGEQKDIEGKVVVNINVDLTAQKEQCPGLAAALAALEKQLEVHQQANIAKKALAQELENYVADMNRQKAEIAEEIKEVMAKLSQKERDELPAGPVTAA